MNEGFGIPQWGGSELMKRSVIGLLLYLIHKVNTLLLNVDKDEFLENYPDNLQIVPAVEVDIF